MKWIIIIFLVCLLIVIITTKFRKQINSAIKLWKFLESGNLELKQKEKQETDQIREVPLVKCLNCGTWIPQTNALSVNSNESYCSGECVEITLKR